MAVLEHVLTTHTQTMTASHYVSICMASLNKAPLRANKALRTDCDGLHWRRLHLVEARVADDVILIVAGCIGERYRTVLSRHADGDLNGMQKVR